MIPKSNFSILNAFPKKRNPLPPEYQAIYEQHYLINRNGKSITTKLSQLMEGWLHRKVAEDINARNCEKNSLHTLEIGAGTLNQLLFERQKGSYDIVEPFKALFASSPLLARIRNVYSDIAEVNNYNYDRITSIAVFEHLLDLPSVVSQAAIRLSPNGKLLVGIPNEGSLLWWLGTQFTGFGFQKRYKLKYNKLMEYEHVNTADEVELVIRYFFDDVSISSFGISKNLSFYRFIYARSPRKNIVYEFIRKSGEK